MNCLIQVFNVPEDALHWIVARYNEETRELWYWGSYDIEGEAHLTAHKVNGVVLERIFK